MFYIRTYEIFATLCPKMQTDFAAFVISSSLPRFERTCGVLAANNIQAATMIPAVPPTGDERCKGSTGHQSAYRNALRRAARHNVSCIFEDDIITAKQVPNATSYIIHELQTSHADALYISNAGFWSGYGRLATVMEAGCDR